MVTHNACNLCYNMRMPNFLLLTAVENKKGVGAYVKSF
jgi:hypothetical protein